MKFKNIKDVLGINTNEEFDAVLTDCKVQIAYRLFINDDYLINDLSRISGSPTYTITVAENQDDGTYRLAQGAENFTGAISIGDGTTNFGSITVNGEDLFYEKIPPLAHLPDRACRVEYGSGGGIFCRGCILRFAQHVQSLAQ